LVVGSLRGGNMDLWAVYADGSQPERLTTDAAQDMQADVSPDGGRIAFVRGVSYGSVPPSSDIWIMDADGSSQRKLVADPGAAEYRPSFSPDGRHVLYTRHADGVGLAQSLWVASVDGSEAPRLLLGNATYGHWSADGRKIAYVGDPAGNAQIWVARADGSRAKPVTTEGGVAPQWSPDGRRIVFTSFRNGKGEIWLVNGDGSGERQLEAAEVPGKAGFATWSPDGRRIAFASTRHTPCPKEGSDLCPQRIYTIGSDGTDLRMIPSDALTDHTPTYSDRRSGRSGRSGSSGKR
jgi:TolB protein